MTENKNTQPPVDNTHTADLKQQGLGDSAEGVVDTPDGENLGVADSVNTEPADTSPPVDTVVDGVNDGAEKSCEIDYITAVDFGDGVDTDDRMAFADMADTLSLSAEQAQQAWDLMHQSYTQQQADEQAESTARDKQYEQTLRAELGDEYDQTVASAQQGILTCGGDELRTVLNDSGIANHPLIVRAFATVGTTALEQNIAPATVVHGNNPFHPDSYNLTEQMRLYRENPSLASALEKAI